MKNYKFVMASTDEQPTNPRNDISVSDFMFHYDTGMEYIWTSNGEWKPYKGYVDCLSTAKPSNPVEGMVIQLVDTKTTEIYFDGQWRPQ